MRGGGDLAFYVGSARTGLLRRGHVSKDLNESDHADIQGTHSAKVLRWLCALCGNSNDCGGKSKREKRGDGCGGALHWALWVIVRTLGEMGSHQVWNRGAI